MANRALGTNPTKNAHNTPAEKVRGVRVNCLGAGHRLRHATGKYSKYIRVFVLKDDRERKVLSKLSEKLGFPVEGYPVPSDTKYWLKLRRSGDRTAEANVQASLLFRDNSPNDKPWSLENEKRLGGAFPHAVGSVILVQANGGHLAVKQVEILCDYLTEVLLPLYREMELGRYKSNPDGYLRKWGVQKSNKEHRPMARILKDIPRARGEEEVSRELENLKTPAAFKRFATERGWDMDTVVGQNQGPIWMG